jgi:glycine hydroxymethyltransferase
MRVGTAAMTTRGLKEGDMTQIVDMVDKALMNHDNEAVLKSIKGEVNEWVKQFPLYL